jgi:hypothetical protein
MRGSLRQWRVPREFRIDMASYEPRLPQDSPTKTEASPEDDPVVEPDPVSLSLLAEIATGLWNLDRRLRDADTGEPRDETRRAHRQVVRMVTALEHAGVSAMDHTGASYDPGQALDVVLFEPTPGAGAPRVTETLRPSVYYRGRMVQTGEVVVGVPPEDGSPGAAEGASRAGGV